MTCNYCGKSDFEGKKCLHCGAESSSDNTTKDRGEKYGPFVYNGFIVYEVYHPASRDREYVFFLGDRLVDTVAIAYPLWRSLFPDEMVAAQDPMQFVWNMFLVQQGDKKDFIVEISNENRQAYERGRSGREIVCITRLQTKEEISSEYSDIPWAELVKMRDMTL